jgi:defect in organelle trafficking protein DotD
MIRPPVAPLAIAIVALLVTACTPVIPVPTTVAVPGMPNPEEALQRSMQDVDVEMTELDGHPLR